MSVTPGSSTKVNTIKGVSRVLKITNDEKTTYENKVFQAGIFITDEDGKLYLTDGVKKVSELQPVVDTKISPLTDKQREALNKTINIADGSYTPQEGGFVVLGTAGTDGNAKIADAQLNLVDANGHLVSTYLRDVLTDENDIIKLEKLPPQMRAHMLFVDTYDKLDELTAEQKLDLVYVIDATGDTSVESGWAIYAWNATNGVATGDPIKIAEGEGLDIDIDAIASTYENVQKAGAIMYDHTLQIDAPTVTEYLGLLDASIPEPEPEPETVTLTTKPEKYEGANAAEVASGLVFGGTKQGNITVTLTGTNCQVKDDDAAATDTLTKTDTIANVNSWLATVTVVIGSSSGSLAVVCTEGNISETIPVTVTSV